MRTLVLDQGYQPHRVVSWQKGITLYFGGKVDVVEEYEDVIRSVSLAMKMPAVVRLRGRIPYRTPHLKFSRLNVMRRDGFACVYCGQEGNTKTLTMDHVVPRARGGQTKWENIVTACRACNEVKADRTPREAGMEMSVTPHRPRWLPSTVVGEPRAMPETWKTWVGR